MPFEQHGPLDALAFAGANSPAYLSALFDAWRQGQIVAALPQAPSLRSVPGLRFLERREFVDQHGWFDEHFAPIDEDRPALIAFSSGTTGRPKALLISHGALADVVERLNAAMAVDQTIREYVGVPVTLSFGAGRARAVAAAGGRSFLPAHGFDPAEIARMLAADEINAISAVPTLWRVVLQNPEIIGEAGKKVRWIEIGSQYLSGAEKQSLKELFPRARIIQHYGLTEASRTTLLDVTDTEGAALESVGRATGRVEIAIAEDGAIKIRGPHLATGLVTGAGVKPITDTEGWLTTADRGRIEGGILYYQGRIDELINSGGLKIDPTQFEHRLAEALGSPDDVAVGRLADPLRGERVLVALRQGAFTDSKTVEQAAVDVAEEFGLAGAGALAFREVADIPRTASGKVQRNMLSELPDVSATPDAPAPVTDTSRTESSETAETKARDLQKLWADVLNVESVSAHESFYDLGGDSLSALTVIFRMEALGLDPEVARGIFDGKTIAELTGSTSPDVADAGSRVPEGVEPRATYAPVQRGLTLAEAMNAVHATRGVLALWVVVLHWLPGLLARLPGAPIRIYGTIDPAVRFGTPGFAMVFGLGIGALGLTQYRRNPAQFLRGTRSKTVLVLSGVLLLALMRFGVKWSAGELDDPELPSVMFYSAVSFYALALASMPFVARLLTLGSNRLLTIFALMVAAMAIHQTLAVAVAPMRPGGVWELLKILLTAKYGYFHMMGFVMVGAGMGYLFRAQHNRPEIVADTFAAGVTLAVFGFVVLFDAEPGTPFADFGNVYPWHLMIYAGFALIILAGFARINRAAADGLPNGLRLFNAVLMASGIMALPIFVGHELVIPAKTFLENLGVPGTVALVLPLGILLTGFALAYWRLMRFLAR